MAQPRAKAREENSTLHIEAKSQLQREHVSSGGWRKSREREQTTRGIEPRTSPCHKRWVTTSLTGAGVSPETSGYVYVLFQSCNLELLSTSVLVKDLKDQGEW